MKRFLAIALVFALLCLIPGTSAFADKGASDVPDAVLDYAQDNGAGSIKGFMKDPKNGYVGNIVTSAEEIDSLTLGKGYRLYSFDLNETFLTKSALPEEQWLFSLDGKNGEVVYFGVTIEPETGSYTYYGAVDAYNLSSALGVMERLAANENVDFAPVIEETLWGYVVAHSFKSGDKVITVPGSALKLDDSYLAVSSSEELPTFEEFVSEQLKLFKPASDAETQYGSGAIELLPRLNGAYSNSIKAASSPIKENRPYIVPIVAGSAVLAILAAAVFLVLKKRPIKAKN